MTGTTDAASLFTDLCRALAGEPGVTLPSAAGASRGFGSDALKVDGRIFAMVTGGSLVLKLPPWPGRRPAGVRRGPAVRRGQGDADARVGGTRRPRRAKRRGTGP